MFSFFKNKNFIHPLFIWVIVTVWYLTFAFGFFQTLKLKTQDLFTQQAFFLFTQKPKSANDIVIVAIDETSRHYLNIKWPWKRSVTAQLVNNIAAFSPKVIGLDIIFSGKSGIEEDNQLISSFKNYPNIILGYTLREETVNNELPLPEFMSAAKSAGYITKPIETDEVIRSFRPFYIDKNKNSYSSLEREIISVYRNKKLSIPSSNGVTPINYLVHPNSFYTIPAYLILEKKVNPNIFKDKIVLIGTTDSLIPDRHLTPLGSFYGITIVANTLVMILSALFLHNIALWQIFPIILIISTLIILMNATIRQSYAFFTILLILFTLFLSSLYLRSLAIQFDYLSVFFLIASAYAISLIYRYCYLLYMSNALRKIAILDPVTKFYTSRFFLLKLDRALKEETKLLTFFSLIISNYNRLSLDLNFEELKSVISLLADYMQSAVDKQFKNNFFCRMSQDMISLCIIGKQKDVTENSFRNLINELKKIEFKVSEETVRIIPKGILIHKSKDRKIQYAQIIHFMGQALKNFKENPVEEFISVNLEDKQIEIEKETAKEDIMDFLTMDLEERNKELEKMFKALFESKKETEAAYFETIRSLITALEEKDKYTQGHSERVAKYALALAKELNLPEEECDEIYKAGLLHDIGKIGIPDYTLHKKERLTDEEFSLIKRHEIMSVEILKPIKPFKKLLPIILHHHEKFDGTGYPYGLNGNMIPQGAQILAVADVFDAITCGRGYKKGTTIEEALKELEKNSGTQFNPAYVKVFKQTISSGRIKF